MDHAGRIARVRAVLEGARVDALLVTNLTNVRYLTGFSGTNGQLLVTNDKSLFMSDPRYAARAGSLVKGAEIAIYPNRLTDVLADAVSNAAVDRLGIEGGTMTVAQHRELADKLGRELIPTEKLVENERRHKDAAEVELIRKAVAISDETFAWVTERLEPGLSEREVALDLEVHMRQAGADDVSFEPIVGSGALSAHIHHTPGDRTFEKGDIVLLDFGCTVAGYCSDLTRTVVLGPGNDQQHDLYRLVLEAQTAGIAAIRPRMAGRAVDAAARSLIDDAGHEEHFGHGLGHGVGLDIHEAPTLNRISEDTLAVGDVVTVEPGVYLPGTGGIRIEDCVVVTEDGAEVLGSAPKDSLIEL